jgi:hypothetical protein
MSAQDDPRIAGLAAVSGADRFEIWAQILRDEAARSVLELGVWCGEFAAAVLAAAPLIERYYMIDPWRPLESWNKPLNVTTAEFDGALARTMAATDFASSRRTILRGTTLEVIDSIPDGALDVAYIDADHTLRGIAIDLISVWPKVRPGGIVGGDDYTASIWQHPDSYEPTLVCPFAAYFAEAQRAPLIILPHNQFVIVKPAGAGGHFRVIDATQSYGPRELLGQVRKPASV